MMYKMETALEDLRKKKPIILCLTNYVTMDFMANTLLAVGAAPLMSCDISELEDLVRISDCLNVNIGTLDGDFIKRCIKAIEIAKRYNKPIIFDPVGVGASKLRSKTGRKFMKFADIIRGNASEILALSEDISNDHRETSGVETSHSVNDAKSTARHIANKYGIAVVVSGKEDFISNGKNEESLSFGSPLMPLITGMGCSLTSIIGAFRSIISDPFEAAEIAVTYFCLCGNLAHSKTAKPGIFRQIFIDELYEANFIEMRRFFNESV